MNQEDKCEYLNQIRQKIAEANGIDFVIDDCTEKSCPKNCQKSDLELKYLEEELEKIQKEGKKINLKGVLTLDFEDGPHEDISLAKKFIPKQVKIKGDLSEIQDIFDDPIENVLPPRYLDRLID